MLIEDLIAAGTHRDLLVHIARTVEHTAHRIKHLEHKMADLQQSLTDLQTAVQTAINDLGGGVQALRDQLAQAQADLAALQVQDDADKAALAQSLADSQAAADTIEAQVAALNTATGTTPDVPPVDNGGDVPPVTA